jgi:hypothetical protein
MRKGFEENLRAFGEVAKEKAASSPSEPTDDAELIKMEDILGMAAERQMTDRGTQEDIYALQKEKQEVMRQLKERLSCLDDPKCRSERKYSERATYFDERSGLFNYTDDRRIKRQATFGEIMTDMEWGVLYHFNKGTVPRDLQKKYLVERAKNEIAGLLDRQIIKSEVGGEATHEWMRETYRIVEEERASGEVKEKTGFIAEKMVKNFLKKISLDQMAPYSILEADIFQDVAQKIDFIIHRNEFTRGVNVEAGDKAKDIGIQFTISGGAMEKKREQVARSKKQLWRGDSVDDIVLVLFPLDSAKRLRDQWEKMGRPAGGPDKLLDRDDARQIFEQVMKNLLIAEEIDTYWEKAKNNFREIAK